MGRVLVLAAAVGLHGGVRGAEHFVNKRGSDSNSGAGREAAFLTIQKGVAALKPGDTLTIGPGEYFENVKLSGLGDPGRETLVRTEIPGTVVLRGDRDADLHFSPVPGRRCGDPSFNSFWMRMRPSIYATDSKIAAV